MMVEEIVMLSVTFGVLGLFLIPRLYYYGKPQTKLVRVHLIRRGLNYYEDVKMRSQASLFNQSYLYRFRSDDLDIWRRNPLQRLKDYYLGISNRYHVFFRENQEMPINYEDETKEMKSTAEMFFIVYRSQSLRRAIETMFAEPLKVKKILFIGIVVVVGLVMYLVLQDAGILAGLGM